MHNNAKLHVIGQMIKPIGHSTFTWTKLEDCPRLQTLCDQEIFYSPNKRTDVICYGPKWMLCKVGPCEFISAETKEQCGDMTLLLP